MKKTFVLAMLLVLALTASTFAASFADVPANHWAYEAVNKLVAAGIIKGYPDGTYGGQRTLTRYEIAVIVARVLEDIEAQRDVLAAKVDKAADSLSKGEAKDVTAIVMALLEKNKPEIPEVELPEGLTEQQADEVVQLIKALTFEFKPELEDLGADISAVAEDVAALEERVAALEAKPEAAVSFSGTYGVSYEEYAVDGADDRWLDPYNKDFDGDDDEDDDDKYTETSADNVFEQSLDLNVAINKGALSADLNLAATVDAFGVADADTVLNVDSLSGTITGNDFVATIGEGQDVTLKPYLFSPKDTDDDGVNDTYLTNGVVVDALGNKYIIASDTTNVLAGTDTVNLLGQDINVTAGFETLAEGNKVVGFDTTLDLAGLTVTPELALNEASLENSKYFTLGATGDLAGITTTFNYALIENFTGIVADNPADKKGFDVKGELGVGPADVSAYYAAYEGDWTYAAYADSEINLEGSIAEESALDLGGFAVTADGQYRTFDGAASEAVRKAFNVSATDTFGKLTVTDTFNFADETDGYFDIMIVTDKDEEYANGDYTAAEQTKKNTIDLDYAVSDALTVGAAFENDFIADNLKMTFDANYEAGSLAATAEVVKDGSLDLTHKYTADYKLSDALSVGAVVKNNRVEWGEQFTANYAQGIFAADFTKNIDFDDDDNSATAGLNDMTINGSVTPAAVAIASFNVAPYAEGGYKLDGSNTFVNYAVGVNADKALSEAATLTAKYEYADKEFGVDMPGIKKTTELGLDYSITEDLTAAFDYVNLDFEDGANDYSVKKASVGVELAF